MDRRKQFRVLYRGFLLRFMDLELLSAGGQMHNLLSNLAALLAAFGFVMMIFKAPQYYFASVRMTESQIAVAAWGDQAFLIATTMMITGIFTVMLWESLFPDRRDCLVLSPLPVPVSTIFAAKVAATGAALGLAVGSLNAFTGLAYPFLLAGGFFSAARMFAAYWITMIGAALFLFCSLVAVQGIALHVLSHSRFLRFSAYLQLTAFFVVVAAYFLQPPFANARSLLAPENQVWLKLIPSFWFLGLYQKIAGSDFTPFGWLAWRAAAALLIAVSVAAITYVLAYARHMHRIVEQSGAIPADRRHSANPLSRVAARLLFRRPRQRAIFLFTARTLARSRQHRMLLAIYGSLGLAWGMIYLRQFLYGKTPWWKPSTPLLAFGVPLLFFTITGLRFCFALPVEVRANWIFRLTESRDLDGYRAAVKRTLLVLAPLPLWIASAFVFIGLWPWQPAAAHLVVLALVSVLVVERALVGFRKIPFTCSYLPGSANLKVRFGAYAILVMSVADIGVQIELASFRTPGRMLVLASVIVAAILWTRRKDRRAIAGVNHRLLFEEKDRTDVSPLDLHADGAEFAGETAGPVVLKQRAGSMLLP